ncbi:MAG: ATP-dependent sacrificial sulfur transferase LarE [Victivallaceae bacterium]|nr:ATP-dependent sacrificial sulfur transferase LarE [Victivallaceae bacterium]
MCERRDPARRLEELRAFLRRLVGDGAALAFSGGVDSSLLLAVLAGLRTETGFKFAALVMNSNFQSPGELDQARKFAADCGVEPVIIDFAPLELSALRRNPPDRCYFCKHAFFGKFREFAERCGLKVLLDGTNADDLSTYRPGLKALREYAVISPLAELGIGKTDIRAMAELLKLRCANKPSTPCLATRFDYGAELSAQALDAVGRGEKLLRGFLPENADLRLRCQNSSTARIEVAPAMIPELLANRLNITAGLKEIGFKYVTLDLEGFRSGCFDPEPVKKRHPPKD